MTNGSSIPDILVHCVFSTKERRDLIPQNATAQTLEICCGNRRNNGISVLAAGGILNHAHLRIALPPHAGAKAIQVLKANSPRWLREHEVDFSWQQGYGAFSVSSSNKHAVMDYIEHQAEHHQKRSYESEFETMLGESGTAFDAEAVFG